MCLIVKLQKKLILSSYYRNSIDSQNYMPIIFVSSSAKRMATQILVIAKLNERLLN